MNESMLYKLWLEKATADKDLTNELNDIKNKPEEINDRFYRNLEFGTGGMRGVIGAGCYRINIYTIRRATQGLSDYIKGTTAHGSVAIAYDSRIKSDLFAKEAARVLAANGIKVYIYPELMPTPMLSYAIRYLGCDAGIVVTASHNPAKYNGYKVYGNDGCQLTLDAANKVLQHINITDMFDGPFICDFNSAVSEGMIKYIGNDVIESYLNEVEKQSINKGICRGSGLKIIYTPLNGTGNKPVRAIFNKIGIEDVTIVKEQENPDGNFPTCPFPNPEIKEALELGLKLLLEKKADLLIATDPDCDRVGIAVRDNDSFTLFSGNEVGALIFEYICSQRIKNNTMPEKPVAVKTIVSTDICSKIAKKYGVELRNVLTGFKFIGEQIGLLEQEGEENRFIFGFEESYGYLAGSYVRDKDAVVGSMLICEMAAYYRSIGMTLIDARKKLYEEYGVFCHSQKSFICEGETGMERMASIMKSLRENPPASIGEFKVLSISDYKLKIKTDINTGKKTELTLPSSDVIAFELENYASVIIRPSGTEPKIKAYYTTTGKTQEEAHNAEVIISEDFRKILGF